MSVVGVIVTVVLLLPFTYIIADISRKNKVQSIWNYSSPPGVGYAASFVVFCVILMYYYFILHADAYTEISTAFTNITSMSSDLYMMGLCIYLVQICRIIVFIDERLIIFKFFAMALQYFFSIVTALKSILSYVNVSSNFREFLYYDYGFYYSKVLVPAEIGVDALSFVALVVIFIFSKLPKLFNESKNKLMKIYLFAYALAFCIVSPIRLFVLDGKFIGQYSYSNKYMYSWLYGFLFIIYRYLLDYVILLIMIFLAEKSDDKPVERTTELEESIFV